MPFGSFLVIGILASVSLACSAVTSLFTGGPPLLQDDFSNSEGGWGTGTDSDSSIEYVDGGLYMKVFKDGFFTWSTPNHKTYQNVHMEITAHNPSADSSPAFGLMCDQQATRTSYYYFAVTPAGQYAIGKSAEGQKDVFLTNNDKWATSDQIAKNAPSYRVGADCSVGTLTLYVNGKKIDSASDTSYTSGGVALFIWSGDTPAGEVTYDDFVMTPLGGR